MTRVIIIALILLAVGTILFLISQSSSYADFAFTGLHVQGNKMVNDSGQVFVPHGVNRSGPEYACIQGWGIFDGPNDAASIQAMKNWGINAVNIGLNEDCWLGINGVNAAYGGANYQQAIKNYVQVLESYQIYPVITYFWGANGSAGANGQPQMPTDHASAFWQSVATTFKDDTHVILHLQEEPHPNGDNTAAWQCWRDGGAACNGLSNTPATGFQELTNVVRNAGAHNIIGVSGLRYANWMDQFLAYKPNDPMNNMIAMVDVYPDLNPCNNTGCYDSQYAPIIAQMPFVAEEFGESVNGNICSVDQSNVFMNWMDQHNSGYLAWVWDTWGTSCGDLSLITDYTGTPHAPNGVNYKNHIAQFANQSPPTTSTPPAATATSGPSNSCVMGDTDGDGLPIDLADYEVWRRALVKQP